MNVMGQIVLIVSICMTCPINATGQRDMDYFAGEWDLNLWSENNQSDKPDVTATWELQKSGDGINAYPGRVLLNGKANTRELISHNPYLKLYTRTIAVAGEIYVHMTSGGWRGDKLVWIGKMYDVNSEKQIKEEINRKDKMHFEAVYYELRGQEWKRTQREVLSRK